MPTAKRTFPVVGMACSACAAHVEKTLSGLCGVHNAAVSLPTRTATIEWDGSQLTPEQMKAAVNAIGYDMIIDQELSADVVEQRSFKRLARQTTVAWGFVVLVMAFSMGWIKGGSPAANAQMTLKSATNCFRC